MKRTVIPFLTILVLLVPVAAACTGGQPSSPTPPPASGAPVGVGAENWQQKWDKLVAEAKKEGKVAIASSAGVEVRDAFSQNFTGKYGIGLEFISGKPTELIPKVLAERRAGLFTADLFVGGIGAIDTVLGPEGALEPMDAALMLPEVLDKKAWWGGDLLWVDTNYYHVFFLAFPRHPLTINKDFVRSDEIKSYRDLLNPKWKGKIVYFDPTLAGGGRETFAFLAESPLGMEYLRELKKQELVFTRDERLITEWVVRGKYPIGVGIKPELQSEFKKAGAPIETMTPVEGTFIGGAGGGIALLNRAPHANAARVFVNWLLSKDGAVVASKAYGGQSAREDVPTNFLDPDVLRQPGVKYLNVIKMEWVPKSENYMKIAKEMWEIK